MPIKLNGATSGYLIIDAPAVAGNSTITFPSNTTGSFVFADSSNNINLTGNLNFDSTQSTKITDPGANVMTFHTSQSERMRIDSTGNVSIGTTTTAIKFNVYSITNPLVANFDTGSASGSYIRFQNSGTSIGDLGSGVNLFGGGGYALDFGLTSRTGGNLVFGTASTERMRIDTSGRVAIGTSSAGSKVEISSGSINGLNITADTNAFGTSLTSGLFAIREIGNSATNNAFELHIRPNGGKAGYITFTENTISDRWSIGSAAGSDGLRFIYGTPISGTEWIRFDSSGRLLIGVTSIMRLNAKLQVYFAGGGSQYGAVFKPAADSTTAINFQNAAGNDVGSINTTATATSFNTSSDYRLKKDIKPILQPALRLMSLKPVNFAWKINDTRVDGFIAHEAQEVVPEAVSGVKDEVNENGDPKYQGIDQSKLVPLLTAALQEAITRIDALEARIATLENT